MMATANLNGENLWYADSVATQHIITDVADLSYYQSYNGNGQIQTASGEGMEIYDISYSTKFLFHNLVQLPRILHVPSTSQKL